MFMDFQVDPLTGQKNFFYTKKIFSSEKARSKKKIFFLPVKNFL